MSSCKCVFVLNFIIILEKMNFLNYFELTLCIQFIIINIAMPYGSANKYYGSIGHKRSVFIMSIFMSGWMKKYDFSFTKNSFIGVSDFQIEPFLRQAETHLNDLLEWREEMKRKNNYEIWEVYTHETIDSIHGIINAFITSFHDYGLRRGTNSLFYFLIYSAAGLISSDDFINTLSDVVSILQST